MDSSLIVVILLIAFIGSLIQSSCGFGYGILTVAVLPFILPYQEALALSMMSSGVLSAIMVINNRDKLRLDVLWPCTLISCIVVTVSVIFSFGQSDAVLTRALGALLILLSIYFFFFSDKIRVRPTITSALIFGAIAGSGAGLFGIGGPPVVIFLLAALDNKDEYRATISFQFLCNSIIATIVRLISGIITPQLIHVSLLAIVPLILGIWLGGYFFRLMSEKTLRRAVYSFMAVSGIVMMLG